MLILVFTSATSRSMFSNSLHLLKPKINFASDCHSINPEQNTKLSFKCATLNALGMQHQTIVVLDCEKFTVAFGDEVSCGGYITVRIEAIKLAMGGRGSWNSRLSNDHLPLSPFPPLPLPVGLPRRPRQGLYP